MLFSLFLLQLTPEQIKARLGKNKNLAELQAKLSKVNNCSAKVKEFYANQVQLKKFDTVEFNLNIPVRYSLIFYSFTCFFGYINYYSSVHERVHTSSLQSREIHPLLSGLPLNVSMLWLSHLPLILFYLTSIKYSTKSFAAWKLSSLCFTIGKSVFILTN